MILPIQENTAERRTAQRSAPVEFATAPALLRNGSSFAPHKLLIIDIIHYPIHDFIRLLNRDASGPTLLYRSSRDLRAPGRLAGKMRGAEERWV